MTSLNAAFPNKFYLYRKEFASSQVKSCHLELKTIDKKGK